MKRFSKMSKFNWWRRGHKARPKLTPAQLKKGRSKLLQQIEHGDFELSPYRQLAERELEIAVQRKDQITAGWKGGQDSLKEKLSEVDFLTQKRYNRLYEDFHTQEQRMLEELRRRLISEFKVDIWDQVLQEREDLSTVEFYHKYKQYATQAA